MPLQYVHLLWRTYSYGVVYPVPHVHSFPKRITMLNKEANFSPLYSLLLIKIDYHIQSNKQKSRLTPAEE